jgi:CRISPR-associated protein Csd2
MTAINNRYDFSLLFDVVGGNPNGDPDAENAPRVDRLTKRGMVTDVCIKRKVRDYVDIVKGGKTPYRIHVQRGSVLNQAHDAAIRDAGGSLHGVADDGGEDSKKGKTKPGKIRNTGEILDKARQAMCAEYYDVRTFGSVLANKAGNDEVRGPVQIGIAFSFHPVLPQRIGITRVAATEAQEGKENKTMGNKWIVPYALYQANGHISVPLARKTGFSHADLDLLWEALSKCFEHDRSATRGMMTARRLIVFRHDDYLGNAPAARLFERIKVARTDDPGKPLIGYDQYNVAVDRAGIPKTVEVIEKV